MRVSHVGVSDRKKDALLISMKLHVQYLRSLEDSERVQRACLAYLQHHYINFYPERPDLMAELQGIAAGLGGSLDRPNLGWKYSWIRPVEAAKWAHVTLPELKASVLRGWDKAMFLIASPGRLH
jgi:hypothetical protein